MPVIGVDSSTSERYISDSHFTMPNFGHVPTVNTDVVNKGYVEWLYLTKSDFDIYVALPGIPVTNGLVMAFIPTLKSCTVSLTRTITAIEDPLTGVKLSALSGFEPNLKLSSDGLWFMEFSNHYLFKENVAVADLGGNTGKTTTFFLIQNVKTFKKQSNFGWVKSTGVNTYDYGTRLSAHIPWSNGIVYVDHAAVNGGRLQQSYAGNTSILNSRRIWSYRRNGGVADLYIDGNHQKQATGLTSGLTVGDVGRFTIGNGNRLDEPAIMDFYGLFFYNRSLTDNEIKFNAFIFN